MSAPARLLSVRLQGFKSFADRTHVEFGPGISAVVGPNGSGKSNLADALRWALGEQGRALRSRKSEDVIWAGSERRPAVGMADVQLTVDNADGLLPVEYGVVELGRRLYRSGENDYLLNRQRVRLRDLVDLLDGAHLADNAFLFIGQGMVDQALALRPEERRPLFEEVAGVRRHDRRRRRAEEQLVESEANLARVLDILAELRPQARRLAAQAEQQASRRSAGDDLAAAIVASAHARWHAAGGRAAEAVAAAQGVRRLVDAAMATLLEHERAIAAAGAALGGHAAVESEARAAVDRARAARAAAQLREGRHGSEVAGAARERQRLDAERVAAEAMLADARRSQAIAVPPAPTELEEELADLDARLAGPSEPHATGRAADDADAAAVRRLESARAVEAATALRRATDAERLAADEQARATRAEEARAEAASADEASGVEVAARLTEEAGATQAREVAQATLATAEASARSTADRAAGARATAGALEARHAEAMRALDAARGGAFDRAAKAHGGKPIGEGVTIEPGLRAAVDAALAELGRAQLLGRDAIGPIGDERGVAIVREALELAPRQLPDRTAEVARLLDAVRSRGGGPLVDAVRRDAAGAVTRLLERIVWLPDATTCLEVQEALPPAWLAVARDGGFVAGEIAAWVRPEARGLHLEAEVERLAGESGAAARSAAAAVEERTAAEASVGVARADVATARERESVAVAARRRADEVARAASARAEASAREAAWLVAHVERLAADAARLRAAVPPPPRSETLEVAGSPAADPTEAMSSAAREATAAAERALRERRLLVAGQLATVRAARVEAERERARAEAAAGIAERQLAQLAIGAADLAEREGRLGIEREDIVALLAESDGAATTAEANLADVLAAGGAERDRLRGAEVAATSAREALRIGQERARLVEREELEARLGLESLHEQLVVELAGLGPIVLRHLAGVADPDVAHSDAEATESPTVAPGDDLDPAALEAALAAATAAWQATPPPSDPPSPGRLSSLRRRFHELGAGNPFAADEYAEAKARLDTLDTQRTDLQAAIDHTRELIRELDRLIGDQFRRTFEALERAFDARFRQLFGGGYAKLSLTDPTDLPSTGVEIVARPPGKKPQALAMLSGGERALTAVALLFAMLEVRPVPFCVLDEVDAALDEANIGRFTDALRELSRDTQCIVITHNRGTIETADALYGVTVGDDSASRVISLRLEEATALAARNRSARAERAGQPDRAGSTDHGAAGAAADDASDDASIELAVGE